MSPWVKIPEMPDLSAPLTLPKFTEKEEDKLFDAQEKCFEAWEEPDEQKAFTLAREAMEISPFCVDAYNIMAQIMPDWEDSLKLYQRGEEVGRAYLGKKFFKECMGEFWPYIEARPYMRAKKGIADSYKMLGDRENAIRHYAEMLDLNENDNQGIRDVLLGLYMETGKYDEARKLHKRYVKDWSAVWRYGRVLLDFQKYGKGARGAKNLQKALDANKYAAQYLSLKKKMPKNLPDMYRYGSKEEAIFAAWCELEAWKSVPGACEWLAEHIPAAPSRKKATKKTEQ